MARAWGLGLLGLAAVVQAQSCNNATTTLRAPPDASAVAACKTYTGSIVVATDFPGPVAELEGTEVVTGDITIANNSQITTIASNSLTTIQGNCILDNLPHLANLTLPKWSSVETLTLSRIPTPNTLNMQTSFQQVTNLYVVNTTLQALPGLLLAGAQMDILHVKDNQYLNIILFGAGNITKELTIANNAGEMNLNLPNLTYSYNMQLTNISELNVPMLKSVSQDLDISWGGATNIALPTLSYVGGGFSLTHNLQLNNISMPQLVNVQGDFSISNNTQLLNVTGFPRLDVIGGSLVLEGQYKDVSMSALQTVGKTIQLDSQDSFNCSSLPAAGNQYGCGAAPVRTTPTNSTSSSSHSAHPEVAIATGQTSATSTIAPSITVAPPSALAPTGHASPLPVKVRNGLSKGAIAGIVVGTLVGASIIVALVAFLILRHLSKDHGSKNNNEETPTLSSNYASRPYSEKEAHTPAIPAKSVLRSSGSRSSAMSRESSMQSSVGASPTSTKYDPRDQREWVGTDKWAVLRRVPSERSMSVYSRDW